MSKVPTPPEGVSPEDIYHPEGFYPRSAGESKGAEPLELGNVCKKGNLETVKHLVSLGANIRSNKDYAVRKASMYGHLEIVKYLVEHGADIRAKNNEAVRW